jgi:hypothetical protein
MRKFVGVYTISPLNFWDSFIFCFIPSHYIYVRSVSILSYKVVFSFHIFWLEFQINISYLRWPLHILFTYVYCIVWWWCNSRISYPKYGGPSIVSCLCSFKINLHLRSSLLWDVTQHRLVVCYRCFETTYRYHLQRSISPLDNYPESSITNYQSTLRNISEERRPLTQRRKPKIMRSAATLHTWTPDRAVVYVRYTV